MNVKAVYRYKNTSLDQNRTRSHAFIDCALLSLVLVLGHRLRLTVNKLLAINSSEQKCSSHLALARSLGNHSKQADITLNNQIEKTLLVRRQYL